MRSKALGLMVVALLASCSSDKQGDDGTGGKAGSGGSSASGGASGAGTSGTGGSAGTVAGNGGTAGTTAGSGGVSGGQGGASGGSGGGAAGSAGMDTDPSIMVTEPETIEELELDDERVYWRGRFNRVMSVPIGGGEPSVVYSTDVDDRIEVMHIAIDDERLYFTDQGEVGNAEKRRGVYAVPLDGSAERELLIGAPTNALITHLAVDAGYVYFLAGNSIARVPTSGGSGTVLVPDISVESPLVVHEGYVYYAYAPSAGDVSQVYRIPTDANAGAFMDGSAGAGGSSGGSSGDAGAGGASNVEPEQISNNTRFSELILAPKVDENYVYWAIYDELYRVSVNGGDAEMFGMITFGTSVENLLAADGNVYWGSGSLFEYVFGGDSNTSVVTAKQGIYDFVVNDDSIFVADGKLLRRIDRPQR
jgi:hypothetical protein